MKKVLLVLVAVLSLSAVSVNAAYAADTKVGVINLQNLLEQLPQMKDIKTTMDKKFAKKQDEITKAQDVFRKSAEDYKKNNAVMSAKDRDAAQNKLIKEEQDIQKMQFEFQRDFVQEQNKEVNALLEKIKAVVAEVAKKEKLDLVLIDASVAYSNKSMDVTEKVLNELKKGN